MLLIKRIFLEWIRAVVERWDRFWFTPTDPATLGLIRILAGSMLLYTHLVWTTELEAFFGPSGWISKELLTQLWTQGETNYFWSHWLWFESPAILWTIHIAALIVFFLLTIGLFSRTMSILAYLFTISYMHRVNGLDASALFGLDQINVMLAFYLMLGPCGACWSIDRLLARRRGGGNVLAIAPSAWANVAIRLIQIHMCVIYFYAGVRKLMGITWWDGSAMWLSFANQEYQSMDMTWLASWPLVISFLTHLTVLFEISYAALIWPRLTRPVVMLLAVVLHLGIAICMGMATFGIVMIIGNMAFVSPAVVRSLFTRTALHART